jgi:hypothetical protein
MRDDDKGENKDPYLENRLRMQPPQLRRPCVKNDTPPDPAATFDKCPVQQAYHDVLHGKMIETTETPTWNTDGARDHSSVVARVSKSNTSSSRCHFQSYVFFRTAYGLQCHLSGEEFQNKLTKRGHNRDPYLENRWRPRPQQRRRPGIKIKHLRVPLSRPRHECPPGRL